VKIAMIGTGYVGLVSGACFSEFGWDVACVDKDVGKIEILDRVSYVAVTKALAPVAAKNLDAGKIKARRFRARSIRPACEARRPGARG